MATRIDPQLRETIHARTDAAAQAAHNLVDRVAQRAQSSEEMLRTSADKAQQALQSSMVTARTRGLEARESLTGFLRRHPVASIGIAFGIGALLAARGSRTSHAAVADNRDEPSVH